MTLSRSTIAVSALLITCLAGTLLHARVTAADPPTATLCISRVEREMLDRVDMWRAVVFGARPLPGGGYALTTGPVVSQSVASLIAQRPSPMGILETKGRLTSELIEPLLASYRTLGCHLESICQTAGASIADNGGTVTVRSLGCDPVTLPHFDECYIGATAAARENIGSTIDGGAIDAACHTLVTQTLDAEAAVLRGAVAYDAGYRASLQTAGILDWLMQDASASAIVPIRDLMGLLGKLHQIPCFIGQCDAPDTTTLRP